MHGNKKDKMKVIKSTAPARDAGDLLLIAFAAMLGAAYIPAAFFSDIPAAALDFIGYGIALAFIVSVIRVLSEFKVYIFMLVGFGLLFIVAGATLSALIVSVIMAVCFPAYIIYRTKKYFFFAMYLPGAIAVYVLTYNIVYGIFAILPILPAVMLFGAAEMSQNKSKALIRVTGGFAVAFAAVAGTLIFMKNGSFSVEIIKSTIESLRESLTAQIKIVLDIILIDGEIIYTEADIAALAREYAVYIFNYLPAIFIVFSMALAYLSHSLFLKILNAKQEESVKLATMSAFTANVISAGIFLLMQIFALILSLTDFQAYAVAAQNMALILEPAMILMAIIFIQTKLMPKLNCSGFMLAFGILILFIYTTSIILPVLAITGAVYVIVEEILSRRKPKES